MKTILIEEKLNPIRIKLKIPPFFKKSNRKKSGEVTVELYGDSQGRGLPELIGSCSEGKI